MVQLKYQRFDFIILLVELKKHSKKFKSKIFNVFSKTVYTDFDFIILDPTA